MVRDLDRVLGIIHYTALVGWCLGLCALWLARERQELPHRPRPRLTMFRAVAGIWGRRLAIFIALLTGIWFLHCHPSLLLEWPTQLKLSLVFVLLFADHWFRNLVAPRDLVGPPLHRWPVRIFLSCVVLLVAISLV